MAPKACPGVKAALEKGASAQEQTPGNLLNSVPALVALPVLFTQHRLKR